MLTFRHFLDNPTWSAAAGYEFNYFDCMSHAATLYDRFFIALRNISDDFMSTEIREIPGMLAVMALAVIGIAAYPMIFWAVAIWTWFRCKQHRNKYHLGSGMTKIARDNIDGWLWRCERDWKKY